MRRVVEWARGRRAGARGTHGRRWRGGLALVVGVGSSLVSAAAGGVQFAEVEPNQSKAAATPVVLTPGDTITGTTTGVSTTATGDATADYWDITTSAPGGVPGWYEYRLSIDAAAVGGGTGGGAGFAAALRGRSQSPLGVVNTSSNVAVAAGSVVGTSRVVQWYGTHRSSRVYVEVTGSAATTMPYVGTLTRAAVTPTVVPQTIRPGSVTITTEGRTTLDTDVWLYDAQLSAIAGAGNDEAAGEGMLQSTLTRTLAAGTYYLAVSAYNLANNQASPADDGFRSGAVLDFADTLATSAGSSQTNTDCGFTIVHSGGSVDVSMLRTVPFGVAFAVFTVAEQSGPLVEAQAWCPTRRPGDVLTVAARMTPDDDVLGVVVSATADLSVIGVGVPVLLTDVDLDGWWTGTATVPPQTGAGDYQIAVAARDLGGRTGTSAAALNISRGYDDAGCAMPVGVGTTSSSTRQSSVNTVFMSGCVVDDPLDVWFRFAAPAAGVYTFRTLGKGDGAAAFDTTLAIYEEGCPGVQIACNDNAGTGTAGSLIQAHLVSGQTVLVRVAGRLGTTGDFDLTITTPVAVGACCMGAYRQVCIVADAAACADQGGKFLGIGTACDQSPGNPVVCCTGNFDGVHGLDVQDLFGYINAWLQKLPVADVDDSGAVDVTDLFYFINAWLSKC